MKLALLGDIHGNDRALAAVLEAACRANVDQLLITGDLVGYYFAPLQVMTLLDDWNRKVVSGNHEVMLSNARRDRSKLAEVEMRYGSGLRIALERLRSDQLDYLCRLPHRLNLEIGGLRILLCHGSPWSFEQYIYPDASNDLIQRCVDPSFDILVLGHTHYPMAKQVGAIQIINPGSVGQPRNRQPGAQWALLDTESRQLDFRVEQYDRSSLIRECQLRHPELPYLAEILERT